MTSTWRDLANLLAGRMYHHAFCDAHPEASADPECPFCRDRAAYRAWEEKSGQTHRRAPRQGEGVLDVASSAVRAIERAKSRQRPNAGPTRGEK